MLLPTILSLGPIKPTYFQLIKLALNHKPITSIISQPFSKLNHPDKVHLHSSERKEKDI